MGDPLAVIYNESQWRLYEVSPLYNLQYTTVKLKQYASKIRQGLVRSVPANSSIKFIVQVDAQPALKYCEDDADGLIITVSTQDNSKTKVAFFGVLLSWGVSSCLYNATHLPYMLELGEQKVGTAVRSSIQTTFDCNIKQFSFTQHQLLQFAFKFVEIDTSKKTDPFTLVYRTPLEDFKDKLSLSFDIGDIHIIWNSIKDENSKSFEQVHIAYQILQNQIFHMVMLDITVFDLCEVALPKANIKNNGNVKMKTPEAVNSVFTVLNEITQIQKQKELYSKNEIV